jgi:hypothetical protein
MWCAPGWQGTGSVRLNRGWTESLQVTGAAGPALTEAIVLCPLVSGIQLTAQAGGCQCGGDAILKASRPVFYNAATSAPNVPTGACRTSGVTSNCNAWYCLCFDPSGVGVNIELQANCMRLI